MTTSTSAHPTSSATDRSTSTATTGAVGGAPVQSTTTVAAGPAAVRSLPGVVAVGGIASDRLIRPTAIILHWWGFRSGSNIQSLVGSLLGQTGYYDPTITHAQWLENQRTHSHGHPLGVQLAVTADGRAYQLTPFVNSYAAHAACGNGWAIGIEIEGNGAADLRADAPQLATVVATTAALMKQFNIPLDGPLASDGLSGSGVHSHKQVDLNCKFADGTYAGAGKSDVDDDYLARVKAALRAEGAG